jgi:DNA-binding MarR family transcriptional regulator/N-acetylglutamate synthase-like GNAT family acetyltransferase
MRDREDSIRDIREFNRFYTNVLGLLDRYMLDSDFSLTEARILYELSEAGRCIANELSVRLQVDKSYLSRILAGFEKKDLVRREVSPDDSRASSIELTEKGKREFSALSEQSNRQIRRLLGWLSDEECGEVTASMETIRRHLTKVNEVQIRPFTDADVSFVIGHQLDLYEKEYGFTSPVWKAYVQDAVHRLVDRFDAAKDCMLILEYRGVPSGCIAVAHAQGFAAQLRFFFLESAVRGLGLGGRLMEYAIAFCKEKQYKHVFLLTNSILDAARYLYRKHGFRLTDAHTIEEWGEAFVEERWDLDLSS